MVSLSLDPQSPGIHRLPNQRWTMYPPQPQQVEELVREVGVSPIVAQLLVNRGWELPEQVGSFLAPEAQELPDPVVVFPDLAICLDLLQEAIEEQFPIAICGDYDADGMTSTALLLRALRHLGAVVDYAIPSRMQDGYGINERIVREMAKDGVRLILTVDNGIAACKPIELARELGLDVIVTDHHDLPEILPEANAILNPKMLPLKSPYCGIAGVGVAYILAISLAQQLGRDRELIDPMRELLALGTIADLAPLTGVNRRWVKQGLRQLPQSQLAGIQALIQVSGAGSGKANEALKPDDIGFRLGPRINAVGRIGDPQVVIELLTTDDPGVALERAMQCEQINTQRQELCSQIEVEAIAWVESARLDFSAMRVLVVVQPDWHHGVIGIVASRLVERYGVPVFIGTYEDEQQHYIRGSARSIPEFNVFEALQFSDDLLQKYGGHRAAGGFSLAAENLEMWRSRLAEFACGCLQPEHLKPLISVDVQVNLDEMTLALYRELDVLHPCGIGNPTPVFWTENVRVVEQSTIRGKHLKLVVAQEAGGTQEAIAWRWGEYCPLPKRVDLAYKLKENHYNGNTKLDLEVVGIRLPGGADGGTTGAIDALKILPVSTESGDGRTPSTETAIPQVSQSGRSIAFEYEQRRYTCAVYDLGSKTELRVRNDRGQVLVVEKGQRTGLLGTQRDRSKTVDVSQPHFYKLIKAALQALDRVQKL